MISLWEPNEKAPGRKDTLGGARQKQGKLKQNVAGSLNSKIPFGAFMEHPHTRERLTSSPFLGVQRVEFLEAERVLEQQEKNTRHQSHLRDWFTGAGRNRS